MRVESSFVSDLRNATVKYGTVYFLYNKQVEIFYLVI